ncbi:MAG: hypothetical protein KDC36_09990 [Thermoleophilia bacterium]|nr:hypothetical protein [Thermoleophilia bacterium]
MTMRRLVSLWVTTMVVLAAGALSATAATPVLSGDGAAGKAAKRITTRAATAPSPTVLSGNGRNPDVLVDAAGTAHIVWTEPVEGGPDVTVYCRLPRAAKACEVTQRLVPPGADEYSKDSEGPQVAALNDQVVVLSHRYPQQIPKATGDPADADDTLYMWTSDDGGRTFTDPGIVGIATLGGNAVTFGADANNLSVGVVSNVQTGGIRFSAVSGGGFQPTAAVLAEGDFVEGRMTVANGVPSVAYHDLGTTSYVRTWSGQGNVNDPATWGAPTSFPGIGPEITSAGGRLQVTDQKPGGSGDLELRDLATGAARTISTGTVGVGVVPIGHPDGTTSVVWKGAEGITRGIWMRDRIPPTGPVRGAPTLISTEEGLFLTADATDDGGGVLVQDTVDRRILLSAFGTPIPTGRPGLGGQPGSGALPADVAVACGKIQLGPAVQALFANGLGCFLNATTPGVKVSEAPLALNGLEIVPNPGVQVQIDLRARTIRSTGTVSVFLRSPGVPDITLFRGRLELDASGKRAGAVLATFGEKVFKPDLLGFPVRGDIDITLAPPDGVRIPVSLELPKQFGDVRGSAVLIANNRAGLVLDSLEFRADGVQLGPATLRRMQVQYRLEGGTTLGDCLVPASSGAQAQPKEWAGVFELQLPPPRSGPGVCGSIRFGSPDGFRAATFRVDLPYPGVVLFPGLSLTSLGGGLQLSPPQVDGTFKVEVAGAAKDVSAAQLEGRLTARLTNPLLLSGQGTFTASGIRIGTGEVRITSDGYASLDLESGPTFGIFTIKSRINGWLDAPAGQFSVSGSGETCMDLGSEVCLDGFAATVSSKGIAVCRGVVPTPVPIPVAPFTVTPPRGAGLIWGDTIPEVWLLNCYASRYAVPGTRQLQTDAAPVPEATADLVAGKGVTFRVIGSSAAPDVQLVAPDGSATTPDATFVDSRSKARYLAVAQPAAGRWTVRTNAGSALITELSVSREAVPPTVAGVRVSGRGRTRTLAYRTGFARDQAVRFLERGAAGTRVLMTARQGSHRRRFTPGPGPGGRRRIVAQLIQNDLVREERTVATYVAPQPPALGRAAKLRIRRSGSSAVISWTPGANASAQRLLVRVPGGPVISRLLAARARRATIPGIRGRSVTVSVTAIGRDGRRGKTVRSTLRAARSR